ncbi:MAG: hypothetical protein JJ866_10140 [Roseibium sp.]|uniref:hypothetical protein n=2 Tax=Roseibium sp. TaxID=1936156 RepID=UPI001B27511C|nr:hypothetical protein [Roseibium sp.]MBO6508278.1 hypothetical protein [Roseibium sp.]MBO6892287.1 hypothetical protein [Roseibium sp.]
MNSMFPMAPPAQGSGIQLIESLNKVGLCSTWADVDHMIEALIELTEARDGDCDLEDGHDAERELLI